MKYAYSLRKAITVLGELLLTFVKGVLPLGWDLVIGIITHEENHCIVLYVIFGLSGISEVTH